MRIPRWFNSHSRQRCEGKKKFQKAGRELQKKSESKKNDDWMHDDWIPELTPFLPPNFVDTNVHAAVAKLGLGDYLCKIWSRVAQRR